jgi:hypothetical protein
MSSIRVIRLPFAVGCEREPFSFNRYSIFSTPRLSSFAFLGLAVMTQPYIPYRHDDMFLQEHCDSYTGGTGILARSFDFQFLDPPREKPPIRFLPRQGERPLVRSTGLRNPA